jgi:hypothetical protein
MAEVKILSRVDLIMYPTPETPKRVKAVTYQSGFMPPRTVYIAEEEYSPDKEREVIGADIKKAETTKPETMEV